jgi:hypothetical protein
MERTGPPDGGPASLILLVRCPHPHTPGSNRRAAYFHQRSQLIKPGAAKTLQPLRDYHWQGRHSILVIYPPASAIGLTHPRATRSCVPRSQRLCRRRFHSDRQTLLSRSVSLTHSCSPSGWNGEFIAASAALMVRRSRHRPHSCTRDSLPSHWPLRGASACGAAPSALAAPRHQCPSRFYRALGQVYIPLHLSDSALCSVRCLAAKLTS